VNEMADIEAKTGRAGGWKRVLLINVGALVGIGISLFIVPEETPLWLWAAISLGALAILNYAQFAWHRRIIRRTTNARQKWAMIIAILGTIFFILDLIFSRFGAHSR
jgi:hypothetical protein